MRRGMPVQCHLNGVEYTKKNPFLANLLQSPRGDAFFEKAIMMFHKYVTDLTQTVPDHSVDKVTFSYLIAGTIGSNIGVLHKWTAEDFTTPAEDVANILSTIFVSGILPHLGMGN